MERCYADPELKVSKAPLERPPNLSIKVDCYTAPKVKDTTDIEPNTEEFEL